LPSGPGADRTLLTYLQGQQAAMVEDLRALVSIDSPSHEPQRVNRCLDWVAARCAALGAHLQRWQDDGVADRLVAVWPGQAGAGRALLLAHVDTVWPADETSRRPFRVEEGRAYGPGAFDMKGGLVQGLWALQALRHAGRWPSAEIALLVNGDEEIGSRTSRPLIETEARRSDFVCVLEPAEPPSGAYKTARKGVGIFQMTIQGRASHAGGQPEKGISAVVELAHQVLALSALTDFTLGTTVNVGVVHGGSRSNVVPAEARAEIDLRVRTAAEADRVVPLILGRSPVLAGAKVTVTGGINRPPMERSAGNVALYEAARQLAAELGFELPEASSGGGSDGNFTAALGVPTLDGMGAVGDGAHALHEHVVVDAMAPRAALLARFLETHAGRRGR
jgi:glutamate carboxypeptidase